ncbi:hypothetical protein Ancab_013860 [Ancistrocladus abbreviatus]
MAWENRGGRHGEKYFGHHHRQYHQGGSRQRSKTGRPPRGENSPVPSWEKKFCTSVGAVPWSKLVETKRIMYLFDNVVKWNDSAGEEAFWNAKNRFWANINGLACDIKLPDPDMYIDEINWDAEIDPELLLDLDRESAISDKTAEEGGIVNLGNPLDLTHSFLCSGWGDNEEELRGVAESHSQTQIHDCDEHVNNHEAVKEVSWDNWEDCNDWNCKAVKETGWDSSGNWNEWGHHDAMKGNYWDSSRDWNDGEHDAVKENRWDSPKEFNNLDNSGYKTNNRDDSACGTGKGVKENCWDSSREWNRGRDEVKENHWDSSRNWNNGHNNGYGSNNRNNHGWGTSAGNCRWRDAAGQHPYRNKGPTVPRDDYQSHRGSRSNKGRKGHNVNREEPPLVERTPSYWRW